MSKFLILARDNGGWRDLSPEEGQRVMQKYFDWTSGMRAAGRLVGSNKLKDGEGRVARGGNGAEIAVKDGPYSETKEVLGGYWLVEASDYDEAMKMVADHPHLRFGSLEVRAIQEMTAP
jgi:hypothetical protein